MLDVDAGTSSSSRSQGFALSERSDGRGMGAGGAAASAGAARWAPSRSEHAGSAERGVLLAVDRLPVGRLAQGPAAQDHGLRLFFVVALGPNASAAASSIVCTGARGLGTQGLPDGGDPRQPECQSGTKRGASIDPQGYDAGKKVTGRKRHILVDTLGLLLNVVVHRGNVQDRDGIRRLLRDAGRRFPSIAKLFADAAYQGPRVAKVVADTGAWQLEIVKRSEAHKFIVLPKRWIVERTFAWIARNRRLARDFERYASTVVTFVRLAMIRIMLRRLTKVTPYP